MHSKVDVSSAEKLKVTGLAVTVPPSVGPLMIVVSGGVVSLLATILSAKPSRSPAPEVWYAPVVVVRVPLRLVPPT